jgi:2-amino-4-hydroxy-6-hydroxymethyldihydropteridine diphosphokinase
VNHAFLGLGGNLGDRRGNLQAAVHALPAAGVLPVRSSATYATTAVGGPPGQPDFLNAALEVHTRLAPEDLLDALKAIERAAGRDFDAERNGPRPVDLDVLLLDAAHASDRLVVPHPRLLERRFVLIPLLELDFDLALPDGARLADALAVLALEDDVRRDGPPLTLPAGR